MTRRLKSRSMALNIAAAVFLSSTVWVGVAASEVSSPAFGSDGPQTDVATRSDSVSAMLAARIQDHPVEDESKRTATTATFANPSGTWTVESYAGIVRSRDDAGEWQAIDSSLELGQGGFEPKAAPVDASYSDGGDKQVARVSDGDGAAVSVRWPTTLPEPHVDGDQLRYEDAADGADLVVESRSDGFSYSIVLEAPPAADAGQLEYRIPLRFSGITVLENEDNSLVLMDGKRRIGGMTAPVMWSGAPDDSSGVSHALDSKIEGSGDTQMLVLSPDMDFLRDPDTTFPVTVDPQFTIGAAGDTYADSSSFTGQPNSAELRVGSNNLGISQTRSYLAFDLSSIAGSGTPTSAEVKMTNFATGSCAGSTIRVSRVNEAFSIPSITWANKPTVTTAGATTNTTASGGTSCAGESIATWDTTQIVSDALGAGTSVVGIEVKADNSVAASGFRKYRSLENGNPANAPKLVVVYNKTPSTPTGVTISPGNPGYATSLTPTLSAVFSDPDGGLVTPHFQIKNHSSGAVVWANDPIVSDQVSTGSRASIAVPAGNLTDGTTYDLYVWAEDDVTNGPAATGLTFKVDVTAPTASITSTGYTNNTWTAPAPSSNTFTFAGSGDTATFDAVLNGVPTTVAANASGAASFYFVGVAEWSTIRATAVDKAGNRGATATFNFGSGAPGFTWPRQNAVATTTFPVDVSAPPTATAASLSWKVQSDTSWRPASQVTTANGTPWTGAVTSAGGRSTSESLVWDAASETYGTGTLQAPAVVNLRACFQYSGGPDKCTYSRTLQLVPSAYGGRFPVASVGPASVALHTGEAVISGDDVSDSVAGLGRSFSNFGIGTLSSGLFGPGWSKPMVFAASSSDAEAELIDNRSRDGAFVVVDPDGGSQTFVQDGASTTKYVPLVATGDKTAITYSPGSGGTDPSVELFRPLSDKGQTTRWELKASDTGGSADWTLVSIDAPETQLDIAVVVSGQRPVFIRESDPSIAGTCNQLTQSVGCRGLAIAYTGTGAAMRIAAVSRVIGAATPGAVETKVLSSYAYDGNGLLQTACSGAPASGQPPLCTTYTYTTAAGRTVLSTITPPGQAAWRIFYDATGRLTSVKRVKPSGGDAVWSVDYSLAPGAPGTPGLSAPTAAQWGQTDIPTKLVAVYRPVVGTASIDKADLYYTTANGAVTNTASHGPSEWQVETAWYNAAGDEVQRLDPAGWSRVQAASVADRPAVAAEASSYTTYNTWGTVDEVGAYVVDRYGPVRTSTLRDGTVGLFRPHVHYTFDGDPSADPTLISSRPGSSNLGQLVEEVTSVSDANRKLDYDQVKTRYGYAPIVAGDGNGWDLGLPTSISKQVTASVWTTEYARFDATGRGIESRSPGGAAAGSGAGNDARSTVTSYYTATGSGDCGGKPAWSGLICKVGPASQPSGTPIPTTFTTAYTNDLLPSTVKEVSGGVTARTTTTAYDDLDRVTSITVSTTGSGVANDTISTAYGYESTTGFRTTMTSDGNTISSAFDNWGRSIGYTDAGGNVASRSYNDAGAVATANDGGATYSYSYDSHGYLTSVDAGGGVGSFTYSFGPTGQLENLTYPNGLAAKRTHNEVGSLVGLRYEQSGSTILAFSMLPDADGNAATMSSPLSTQKFTYDYIDRLTKVESSSAGSCTTRTYTFDAASNRTGFASYGPGAGGGCQSTTSSVSRTNTFDTAGRITSPGYTYDDLGRALTVPAIDTVPGATGPLNVTPHATDLAASTSQVRGPATFQQDYSLDPAGRAWTRTQVGSPSVVTNYRYSDASDSPASTVTGGVLTRNVSLPVVGLAATKTGASTKLVVANLHGDVVADMDNAPSAIVAGYSETDEFGRIDSAPSRTYGYVGVMQRASNDGSGVMQMGVRLYNPATGSFLSADPVRGGNRTPYSYPEDPVNSSDPTGMADARLPLLCTRQPWIYTYKWYLGPAVGYTFRVTLSWCTTVRNNLQDNRVTRVRSTLEVWSNAEFQTCCEIGPADQNKVPKMYDDWSRTPRMYVHYWFKSRQCGVGFINCFNWNTHHFSFSLGAYGSIPQFKVLLVDKRS